MWPTTTSGNEASYGKISILPVKAILYSRQMLWQMPSRSRESDIRLSTVFFRVYPVSPVQQAMR